MPSATRVEVAVMLTLKYFRNNTLYISAKTRSDRDKLCHFWSKMKSQESQNKPFLFKASYLVHLILAGFC